MDEARASLFLKAYDLNRLSNAGDACSNVQIESSQHLHNDIIFHVGMPKCGSTMLQRTVFPRLQDMQYLNDPEYNEALVSRDFPGGELMRKLILEKMRSQVAVTNKPSLFSSEHLSMPADWLETMDLPRKKYLARDEITDLIKQYFPDAKILLVIRQQEEWIASWFQERVKRYETRSLSEVVNSAGFKEISDSLHYAKILEEYEDAFGKNTVKVIPMEFLRKDSRLFFDEVMAAIGIPEREISVKSVNARQSRLAVSARRSINKVLKAISRLTGHKAGLDDFLFYAVKRVFAYDWIFARILGPYRESLHLPQELMLSIAEDNNRMTNELSVDLHQLGYRSRQSDEWSGAT